MIRALPAALPFLAAGPALAQVAPADVVTPLFAPYSHALAALALWALLLIVLTGLSGHGTSRRRTDSGHPARDYSDPAYRRSRAHLNAVETSGVFVAATVAAILAGGPPFWVNLFAALFMVARIAMAAVHIGTENQMLRSACYVAGVVCTLTLAVMALIGAFVS
ncbi:MAPEG family protein [Jannaschia rubra]|uniref:MAPEG family protein n=1 Tax=Jannaschia rubra TaxID=282197 RepID=A0A0M6XTR3_9RHOB|nr:MAPEG family protein [Jannaschia rubra]CTQ33575.1 MAPEG family protein [Jannaschia rubra]SFG04188.1 Uncharacterized conserved protein, MAPEG superfamily [Jannaschia rubra]